jgi:inorganic pyrophosphatase
MIVEIPRGTSGKMEISTGKHFNPIKQVSIAVASLNHTSTERDSYIANNYTMPLRTN